MRSCVAWVTCFLSMSFAAVSAEETGPPRIVKGLVVGVDDKPSSGTEVWLVGVGRLSHLSLETAMRERSWVSRSDEKGRFTVGFAQSTTPFDERERKKRGPGWGSFHLVVLPGEHHAGAVSPRIVHYRPEEWSRMARDGDRLANEWGPFEVLGEKPLGLLLRLRKGIVVEGVMVDQEEKAVPGAGVLVYQDLHAGSHTGYGGEIFEQRTETAADGRFRFDRV
ncbi:MAG TPA: hypothetical protein VM492_07205, partial [Sumerlaeia bacterium]|nr:hypothetical protein [Sumerlaeia bacterium]